MIDVDRRTAPIVSEAAPVRDYIGAVLAVARRDLQIFLSYRFGFLTQIIGTFFSLTLFHFLSRLVHVRVFASPDAYYAFVVVGLIILQMLNSTLQGPPTSLRGEIVAGTFERMAVSPFGPTGALAATLVFPFANAVVMGTVMLAFTAFVFGLPVRWSTVPLLLPVGALGVLAYAPFGLLLMALVIVVKQATSGMTWVVAGISIVAGLYFPVTLLPHWFRWATKVQPFTPSVDILRNVLIGTRLPDPVWADLLRIIGFIVACTPLAVLILRRALAFSRKRGTLLEY